MRRFPFWGPFIGYGRRTAFCRCKRRNGPSRLALWRTGGIGHAIFATCLYVIPRMGKRPGGLKRPAHGKYRRRGKGGQQREGGGRGKGRRPRHEGRGLSGVRECRRPCVRGGTGGEVDAAMHAYGPGGGDFELKDVQSSSKSQEDASCMRRGCTYPGVLKQADPLAACTGKTRAVPPAASKRASKTME